MFNGRIEGGTNRYKENREGAEKTRLGRHQHGPGRLKQVLGRHRPEPDPLNPAGPSFLSDSVGPRFFSNLTGPRFPSRPGWAEFHPCDPAGPDSVTRLGRITSTRVGRLSSDPGGPESHHSAGPASCYSAGPGISSDVDHSLPNHPSIHRSIASSPAEGSPCRQ